MVTLSALVPAVQGEFLVAQPDAGNLPVGSVIASDLMSDVLMNEGDNPLLLTSLSTVQALHTAEVIGARAIIIGNRKRIDAAMRETAHRLGLAIIGSPLPKYEACVAIGEVFRTA